MIHIIYDFILCQVYQNPKKINVLQPLKLTIKMSSSANRMIFKFYNGQLFLSNYLERSNKLKVKTKLLLRKSSRKFINFLLNQLAYVGNTAWQPS